MADTHNKTWSEGDAPESGCSSGELRLQQLRTVVCGEMDMSRKKLQLCSVQYALRRKRSR
jgi:hypothetical protein